MSKLADINKNFSKWYQDVLEHSEFIDNSPVRGCFVLRPDSFALWENIQKSLDKKIKQTGTKNAYFPLLIPESFLKKEAKHVEGFAPEVAVVTHAGGKKLDEPLVIRPTSETIIYHMFAKWIKSWRDLPIKVNMWDNIVRWEMRTRPFLRTIEILFQEGHTAHSTHEEAVEMAEQALEMYKNFVEEYLAIPVIAGEKTESERFAGAERTYCIEGLMQDGKGLQIGTTHVLLKSFSESFGMKFQDKDGKMKAPQCSSWGVSTRLIGAIVMMHGDQNGLIIPPKIAPIQTVIIPIFKKDEEKSKVLAKANELKNQLEKQNISVIIDDCDQTTPGAKFFKWEIKGIPVRIEIGPKDIEKNQVVLVNRAEQDKSKKKQFASFDNVSSELTVLLDQIQKQLFLRAKEKIESNWHQAEDLEKFGTTLKEKNGYYQTGWCGSAECETKLKEFQAGIRCLLKEKKHNTCFCCKQSSKSDVLVAKAY